MSKSGRECRADEARTPSDVVGRAAAAGPDDVDAAVKAAEDAFEAWGFGPPAARREILTKAADLLTERAEEISAIVTEETGGTFGWGCSTVSSPAACCARPGRRPTRPSAR